MPRSPDVALGCPELGAHIDHIEVGVLAGTAPLLDQREQLAIVGHRLFGERQQLVRLDRQVPGPRRRRRQRLACMFIVECRRLVGGLGGRPLRPQFAPDIEFPADAGEGGCRIAGTTRAFVVERARAERRADLRQELRADHRDGLLGSPDLLCGLAQVEVVGNRLGHNRAELRVVQRLQPVVGDPTFRRRRLPRGRDARLRGQRPGDDLVVRRCGRQRASGEQCRSDRHGRGRSTHQPENG